MELQRRGFLRLMGAAAAAVGLVKYAEPIISMTDHGEWIEDRGDYYIVRVPDFKTFREEFLGKPTIFGLGEGATVANVTVHGFSNIYAPRGGTVKDSVVDASRVLSDKPRPVLTIGDSRNLIVSGCHLMATPQATAAIQFSHGMQEGRRPILGPDAHKDAFLHRISFS